MGLTYDNEKISSFLQKWDGNTLLYKQGKAERTSMQGMRKRDNASIFCDIKKGNESWSRLFVMFNYIEDSSVVGNFISELKKLMQTKIDNSGKFAIEKSLAESLTIKCPFGWKIDEIEGKIKDIISKYKYFGTSEPVIIITPKTLPKKNKDEYSNRANAFMGLKRTEVKDGISKLIGSGFEYISDKYEKTREVDLIKIDDNKKIVEISRGFGQVENSPKVQKLTNIAKKFAKENKYKYVQWFYPRLEIDENGKVTYFDKQKQNTN